LYHIVKELSAMPQLLVSVRDCEEAAVALAAGVDLIDVKEPRAGSLGAAKVGVIDGVLRQVNGRRPVSVALGELVDGAASRAQSLAENSRQLPPAFAKIGLAHCAERSSWQKELQAAFSCLHSETVRVAVAYADVGAARSPEPDTILNVGSSLGCRAALLDTFDKRGPGLLRQWSVADIVRWLSDVRRAGMQAVLAGQLSLADCKAVSECEPDFIAVRGAVCWPDRCGQIDSRQIAQLKEAITSHHVVARRGKVKEQHVMPTSQISISIDGSGRPDSTSPKSLTRA